jgi:hypothetical protein
MGDCVCASESLLSDCDLAILPPEAVSFRDAEGDDGLDISIEWIERVSVWDFLLVS